MTNRFVVWCGLSAMLMISLSTRTLPGSTNPGNHQSLTQTGLTKALKGHGRLAHQGRTMVIRVATGSTKSRHGSPRRSRLAMVACLSWNTPDLEGIPYIKTPLPEDFEKILGKAGRKAIFALEWFPNESGCKPLSLAQTRRSEVPVSTLYRNTVLSKHRHPSAVPRSPRNPHFPALRSGHRPLQRPSQQKKIPRSL